MRDLAKFIKRYWILTFALFVAVETLVVVIQARMNILRTTDIAIDLTLVISTAALLLILLRGFGRTETELNQNKQKLQSIFDTLDVAIWSHDMVTDQLLITPGIEKLYGYSLEEFYRDKTLWRKVILPEDMPVIKERENQLAKGESVTSLYRIIRPDGEVRWIQDRGIPGYDQSGTFVHFTSVLFDITDRKESEDRYRSLVEMSPDLIAVVSQGKIDYINPSGLELLGADRPEQMIGKSFRDFLPPHLMERYSQELQRAESAQETERRTLEFQLTRLDGTGIDVEVSSAPILYGGRAARQVVGRDITQRKKAERTIRQLAYTDALTELPNRYMFRQQLNRVLTRHAGRMAAVLFLDLDRFKMINDTKGHTVGDFILQKVARRLAVAVGRDGMVSRQGGDEFIIYLEDTNREKAEYAAQRLLDEFAIPIEHQRVEYFVTPSIGISLYPADGTDEDTLIKNADTAMYLAKDRGKNNYQFYTPQLHGVSSRKMELETALRKALEWNQLEVHYQPQIELATGRLVGVEALVRWNHPDNGTVSPGEFIPLAEETGLIVLMGKWVLRKACEQSRAWRDAGYGEIPMAVNISVRQMDDDKFVDWVAETLHLAGLEPCSLELEITESIMQNIEKSSRILNRLKRIGVQLSIDDFGTGYSSLSYLKYLPIDKIKIDKSFIDDIVDDESPGDMVKTIIDMGHNLDFTVIAEGIEREEQLRFLIRNGCRIGQGYLFSRPLPADRIESLLRNNSMVS